MAASLYAGLSEFAVPTPTKKEGGEEGAEHVSAEKGSPKSLFERVNSDDTGNLPAFSKANKSTDDVLPLVIHGDSAAGNLSDGYRLHELAIDNFDSGEKDPKSALSSAFTESAAENSFAAGLPIVELDFSSESSIKGHNAQPTT